MYNNILYKGALTEHVLMQLIDKKGVVVVRENYIEEHIQFIASKLTIHVQTAIAKKNQAFYVVWEEKPIWQLHC